MQPCDNLGTTLYFETVVTRWWQGCHKVATMHLVTTLYFETVARLLQGGGKAVTKALSQPCIMKL